MQHFLYNLVEPNQVRLYGRPANATNEVLWQKAMRENPDPTWLVVLELVNLGPIDSLPAWSPFLLSDSTICKNE